MPHLNASDIRKLPTIYRWSQNEFDCTYHHDPESTESLKIFIERNIDCEAQYLYLFELTRAGIFFALNIFKEDDTDAFYAGRNRGEATEFVLEEMLEATTLDENWEKRHPTQVVQHQIEKEELKKVIAELIRKFIG